VDILCFADDIDKSIIKFIQEVLNFTIAELIIWPDA